MRHVARLVQWPEPMKTTTNPGATKTTLRNARRDAKRADAAKRYPNFCAFWAGSASSSVEDAIDAGNVVVIDTRPAK